MIVPNQRNIKVHFAGVEDMIYSIVLTRCGVKYNLFSAFKYIAKKSGVKVHAKYDNFISYLIPNNRHTIMDSGLYSLLFGAYAEKRSPQFISKYYDTYIEFLEQINYNGAVVEVDCQNIVGDEHNWMLRKKIATDLPNNRIINVFHPVDKQKGLDKLIEYTDYIGVPPNELKWTGKGKHIIELVHYIKNKKPSIDIHLLGCTDSKLLKALYFCTTTDSTSWKEVGMYGAIKYKNGLSTKILKSKNMDTDKLRVKYALLVKEIKDIRENIRETHIDYILKIAYAIELKIKEYSLLTGSQD